MSPGTFEHLHLIALYPYALVLSKPEQNIQRDRDQVRHLARAVPWPCEEPSSAADLLRASESLPAPKRLLVQREYQKPPKLIQRNRKRPPQPQSISSRRKDRRQEISTLRRVFLM